MGGLMHLAWWLLLAYANQSVVPGTPGSESKIMPNDPFFTSVVVQLMNPPPSSRDALLAANQKAPPVPPNLVFEVDSARSWVKLVLQSSFQPRAADPFVTFPSEGGRFDVIRSLYHAGGIQIAIAQSKYVICVSVIADPQVAGQQQGREKAEIVAHKIISMADRIRLTQLGLLGNGQYGRQDVAAAGRVDPDSPHWLDTLRWWSHADVVGFVMLKATGGPTRAVISIDDQANQHWF
jgi:hypothetical protein